LDRAAIGKLYMKKDSRETTKGVALNILG